MSSSASSPIRAAVTHAVVNLPVRRTVGAKTQRALDAWINLDPAAKESWATYAKTQRRYDVRKGRVVGPSPRAAFISFAKRRWSLDDSLSAPTEAPVGSFFGDHLSVVAARRSPSKGIARLEATGTNTDGVFTEILVQRVGSAGVSKNKFKTAAFIAFTNESRHFDIKLSRGHYAFAYRFVRVDTMQTTELIEAGPSFVGVVPTTIKQNTPIRATQVCSRLAEEDGLAGLRSDPHLARRATVLA